MKRLVILDPSLLTLLSHNYSEANALLREATEISLATEIFCHRDAEPTVREIPAKPYFQLHGYGHMVASRPATDFMAVNYSNQAIRKDLSGLTSDLTPDDFIFFPTVTCNMILAISQWLNEFKAGRAPRFGFCLMFPPTNIASGRPSHIAKEIYQKAFDQFPAQLAERIVFTCEVDRLSDTYASMLGVRPLTLPIPTCAATRATLSGSTRELRIVYLGAGRAEKGFHLLPDLLPIIHRQHPEIRFMIQGVGYEAEYIKPIVQQLRTLDDYVTLIERPISDEELLAAMQESDLLLLPYDAERYMERGSMLFTEAKRTGIPMILPQGTEFGDEGESKGIAETFDRFSPESIAAATLRAIDQLDELSAASGQVARTEDESHPGYIAVMLRRLGCSIDH